MNKMLKQILVIKNNILFNNAERFNGFSNTTSYEGVILKNYEFMVRGDAEINFSYKQPIPYAVIVEEWTNKVFVYKRWWSTSTVWETRLHDKISFGIGWHIEPCDENCSDNILTYSLKREIEEELNLVESDIVSTKLVGFINDDSNEVWKVHFGVFYKVYVRNSIVSLNDWELANWEFLEVNEIEKMVNSWDYDVETWSQIIFDEIKKIV